MTLVDFDYPISALWFYCSQTLLNYLAFQSFGLERHLMTVIPETCCATKFDIYVLITESTMA